MKKNLKQTLDELSRSIDKSVLDNPRLDFKTSAERFPELGTQIYPFQKDSWGWNILSPLLKPARIPVLLRTARLQIGVGVLQWLDHVSHVAVCRHRPIPRNAPLFLADVVIDTITDKDDPNFGRPILRLCEPLAVNHYLLSWFKANNIKAEIDPSAPIAKCFSTDDKRIRPVITQQVHCGIFLSEHAHLARTVDPDRNPAILDSAIAVLLATGVSAETKPRVFNPRLISQGAADPDQVKAIHAALSGENFVLIGPPGCGKTQTISAIIANMNHQFPNIKIGVASPVEAALQALRRLTGNSPPSYREFVIGKSRAAEPIDLLIVDESSRVTTADTFPFAWQAKQIIIIGDDNQTLPSPSAPKLNENDTSLIDLALKNPGISQYRLTHHYRSFHPELLTFSNSIVYDGLLKVVPAPNRSVRDGLHISFVPDAMVYPKHSSTENALEAEVLAARLIKSAVDAQSLGITRSRMVVGWTYNQTHLLEKCIKKRLKLMGLSEQILSPVENEPFAAYIASDVQGQERDEAWISFGHGINPKTKKIAKARQQYADMSNSIMKKMNVVMTRSRFATHLYHSVTLDDILRSEPSPELLALFGLINSELIVAHSRFELQPHREANYYALTIFRDNPAIIDPEAINLACVYGVRNKGDQSGNFIYGLFNRRKEWTEEQSRSAYLMLIRKGWKIHNF